MTPQELKNSILQLAIQGKLVEQRPEEGTASELYAQIQAEKQKLIKDGKLKKEKPLPEITDDEKPFDIPEGWMWVRLGQLSSLVTKGTTPRGGNVSYLETGIGFLRAENVAGLDKLDKTCLKCVDVETHQTVLSRSIIEENDILITIAGTLGRTALVRKNDLPLNSNQAVSIIRPVFCENDFLLYIIYALNSGEVQKRLTVQKKATAIPNLTLEIVENCAIPLPPLGEQKRIVAKIEELLPLVDRYEQAWSKLEDFNKHFPGDMQKSLLQMAIQGKLVEQRPEEGTGEELYRQIQSEKQKLIKEGKLKKEKPLPEIKEEEKPFDIPDGWKWVRLGYLLQSIEAGKSIKCSETPPELTQCGIIKVSSVSWGSFRENESKACISKDSWKVEYAIKSGDFLISRANTKQLVGACVIVNGISKQLMLSDKILRLTLTTKTEKNYLLYSLRSSELRKQIESYASGTSDSMKNISQNDLRNLILPLPPLAEQKRIVESLEELLPLYERLK